MKRYIVIIVDLYDEVIHHHLCLAKTKLQAVRKHPFARSWPDFNEMPDNFTSAIKWMQEGDLLVEVIEVDA